MSKNKKIGESSISVFWQRATLCLEKQIGIPPKRRNQLKELVCSGYDYAESLVLNRITFDALLGKGGEMGVVCLSCSMGWI